MSTPGLEILAWEETPLGVLCLRRRPSPAAPGGTVTEITLDHEFLMSSLHSESEEALATRAIAMHGGDGLRVLVGGLGLGCTAAAALDTARAARVRVVELLPCVIDWLRDGLLPLSGRLAGDARIELQQGDVYAQLACPGAAEHDVILIDVDHSPEERLDHGSGRFYTGAGLAAARGHLAPSGVLAVWSSSPSDAFESAMRATFSTVGLERITFRNRHLGRTQTDWIYLGRV